MRVDGLVGVNGAPPKTIVTRTPSVVIDARVPPGTTDAREGRIWAA